MKIGVTLSSAAHVAILSWGLLSLPTPAPLEVADVEAISVDVIPFEEISKTVQGDKRADLADRPAPIPTKRPAKKTEAVNVGETDKDFKTQLEPKPADRPVEVAKAEAPPAPVPMPKPDVVPEPQTLKQAAPAPTTELAALTQPSVPVTQIPTSEDAAVSETGEQFVKLPDTIPVPTKRPKAPKPKSAETTSRKKSEKPVRKKTATSDAKEKSKADELAVLINKQKPTAAGAKSSNQRASLGGKKPTSGEKLSQNEMDALRSAIEGCWSIPSGLAEAEDMRATVTMNLATDGSIDGKPTVTASGGESGPRRAFEGSVMRAVQRCAPYSLPKNKYDTWAEVVVNFDASELF